MRGQRCWNMMSANNLDVSTRALAASLAEVSSHYHQSVTAGVFIVWTCTPPRSTAAGEQKGILLLSPLWIFHHPLFWIPDLWPLSLVSGSWVLLSALPATRWPVNFGSPPRLGDWPLTLTSEEKRTQDGKLPLHKSRPREGGTKDADSSKETLSCKAFGTFINAGFNTGKRCKLPNLIH